MSMKKVLLLGIIITGVTFLFADEVTKILQNGLEGYDGCNDSYLYNQIDSPDYQNENHGAENTLRLYRCPT